ncbi:MAG: TonB family protein [Elusimicrobia bacterium]|nr:TonB family protein [Elusimicrobiota bacterium]
MKFRDSIIISALFHAALFILVPDLWFDWERKDWVVVSVATFPDMDGKLPNWNTGREPIEPKMNQEEILKRELPLSEGPTEVGVPVEPLEPDMDRMEKTEEKEPFENIFDKIVPEKVEKEKKMKTYSIDRSVEISGPAAQRQLLRDPRVEYPEWAKEKGIEGEVKVKFWVAPEGFVTKVEVEKTSGFPDFDSRAIESVRKYLFAPLGKNEEQKEQWGERLIIYSLTNR